MASPLYPDPGRCRFETGSAVPVQVPGGDAETNSIPNRWREREKALCFPLEGYGPSAIGGKKGSGYKIQGYDFFDGDRHKGHPGHDIFIRDKDQDGLDDFTGKPVNVVSAASGVAVSVNPGWEVSSPVRGGNYVWIYEPGRSRYYYYAHLQKIFVKIGQRVARGERIGTVGRTGTNAHPRRSPTHLHLAVLESIDGYPRPVNPYYELIQRLSSSGIKKVKKSLDNQERK